MAKKKKRSAVDGLAQNPLVRNLLWICAVMAVLIIVASVVMHFGTRHGSHRTVPDFSGMPLTDAERLARREGLRIIVNDSLFVPAYDGGAVLDQLPKGGVEVKAGRKIYVTVNSSRQKSVRVPYVAGRSLRQAKNMLEAAGLEISLLEYVDDIATNYVLAEYLDGVQIHPESTLEAEMGTGVKLRVGVENGFGTSSAPKLIGLTLPRAKGRIWEMGLNVGRITYDADVERLERGNARVYFQSVGASHTVALGSVIDIKLTTNNDKIYSSDAAAEAELQRLLKERSLLEREADSLQRVYMSEHPQTTDDGGNDGIGFSDDEEDEFFQ